MIDLPLIPGVPEQLIRAINERLRSVSGATSTPQAVMRIVSRTVSTEGYSVIPVHAGHATPNLDLGLNQEVVLTSTTAIDGPLHGPGSVTWTLILVQDSTGGHAVTFAPEYRGSASIPPMLNTSPDTYTSIDFVIRNDGTSQMSNIITGVPIA